MNIPIARLVTSGLSLAFSLAAELVRRGTYIPAGAHAYDTESGDVGPHLSVAARNTLVVSSNPVVGTTFNIGGLDWTFTQGLTGSRLVPVGVTDVITAATMASVITRDSTLALATVQGSTFAQTSSALDWMTVQSLTAGAEGNRASVEVVEPPAQGTPQSLAAVPSAGVTQKMTITVPNAATATGTATVGYIDSGVEMINTSFAVVQGNSPETIAQSAIEAIGNNPAMELDITDCQVYRDGAAIVFEKQSVGLDTVMGANLAAVSSGIALTNALLVRPGEPEGYRTTYRVTPGVSAGAKQRVELTFEQAPPGINGDATVVYHDVTHLGIMTPFYWTEADTPAQLAAKALQAIANNPFMELEQTGCQVFQVGDALVFEKMIEAENDATMQVYSTSDTGLQNVQGVTTVEGEAVGQQLTSRQDVADLLNATGVMTATAVVNPTAAPPPAGLWALAGGITTLDVVAKTAGASGNDIALSSRAYGVTPGGSTLAGGVDGDVQASIGFLSGAVTQEEAVGGVQMGDERIVFAKAELAEAGITSVDMDDYIDEAGQPRRMIIRSITDPTGQVVVAYARKVAA